MEKKLTVILALLAFLCAGAAAAQKGERGKVLPVSTGPAAGAAPAPGGAEPAALRPGDGLLISSAPLIPGRQVFDVEGGTRPAGPRLRKFNSLSEGVAAMEPPEDAKKTKRTLKVYQSSGTLKETYTVKVPKGNWRVLWRLEALDPVEHGKMTLGVLSAGSKDSPQEFKKEVSAAEGETFGIFSVCDTQGGYYLLAAEMSKVSWRFEVQALE